MITDFFSNLFNNINLFDIFFLIILVYNVAQCFIKGFSLSLISFMKWVFSTIITGYKLVDLRMQSDESRKVLNHI